jgi:hypothetical protein
MKTLIIAALLCVTAAGASDTNKMVSYRGHYLTQFRGAQTYKDAESGIIFYVESDGRHLAAIDRDGKILWHRDPFADAKLEYYRTKTPQIVYVGKPREKAQEYWAGKQKKVISIGFNSSQFGEVDINTGEFHFAGQD